MQTFHFNPNEMGILNYVNWDLVFGDGLIITVIGYLIVFIALLLLTIVFNFIPKILRMDFRAYQRKKEHARQEQESKREIPGEVNAAIGTAIYLFLNEMHDVEDPVITIRKVSKSYTPWSSKIYGVTRGLNRRF